MYEILSLTNCPLDPNLGSGKTVLTYSQGLQKLEYSVDVAEPKDYEIWQSIGKAKKFRQAWGAWRFVKQKLKAKSYNLIEFYGDEFWLTTWQLSKLQNRPLLVAHTNGLELLDLTRFSDHNPHNNYWKDWFVQQTHARFSEMAFAYADAFVSLCELDRQHVLNLGLYPVEKTAVVEPGLDEEYLSLPFIAQKEERVAFMGTWITRKGIGNLSAVMTKVLSNCPNVYFDIYGTGGAKDTILASFSPKLHNRITVYPRLSNQDIAKGLGKAKVFFFPSQYEGFGIALAEAMACSCAAVTTLTGFGAALKDEREALLCEFDNLEGMEYAVLCLLQDDGLRLRIARGGWERVRSLSWDSNIKKLAAIYSEWITQHQIIQKIQ
jgi:glycosyltransferase involved in cell wall biosynthesis